MSTTATSAPKKTRGKKRLIVLLSFIVALTVMQTLYKRSGSNQWELVKDSQGVEVYTLKEPGTSNKQFRGIVTLNSNLAAFAELFQDFEACEKWIEGCTKDGQLIEELSSQIQFYLFRLDFPSPFKPRETLIRTEYSQDAQTKALQIVITAAPDKIKRNECCLRLEHMNVTWHVTPQRDGTVELVYEADLDMGGNVPDFLINARFPDSLFATLSKLQGVIDKPSYQSATRDFISEATATN